MLITFCAYNKWRKESQFFKLITNNNKKETMNKLNTNVSHFLYALLVVVFLVGCTKQEGLMNTDNPEKEKIDTTEIYNTEITYPKIVVIEDCEYIQYQNYAYKSITHKGNCKYCLARNAK